MCLRCFILFFFNDTATTEIYTLSLHDALPIFKRDRPEASLDFYQAWITPSDQFSLDRKSTRLNSSHVRISYAVFCLKKKKKNHIKHLSLLYKQFGHHEHIIPQLINDHRRTEHY